MKRLITLAVALILVAGGILAYNRYGGSPEVKRDRALKAARAYLESGKTNEALREFRNALKADPGSAEVHYEFAVLLIKQGDLRSAYGELVRAIERKPNYYQARYQLATLHLLAKDPQRAKPSATPGRTTISPRKLPPRKAILTRPWRICRKRSKSIRKTLCSIWIW